jgi:N-acetyl-alpha-D-muramate 1-phosphate uridylyltransferase
MSLPVVVLAGGLATRLGPLTQTTPKSLLEVAGRPFVEHQMDLLQRHGLRDVVFCIGHHGDQIAAALGDGSRWDMRFQFVSDGAPRRHSGRPEPEPKGPRLLGTGGAIRAVLPLLGDAFFVLYGDSYLECDYAAIESAFRRGASPGLMTVYRNDDRFDRSNVQFEDGRIVVYDKRHRTPAMHHIDYGLGILTPAAFDPWSGEDAAFDLASVYQHLVSRGELMGYEVGTRFYEIGSAEGLAETRALLAVSRKP